jgi:hypothetical protein
LFHVNGKRLGPMTSELPRTCAALGIPYGRRTGLVFHDKRHSAVTNLVACGTGEAAAMSITGNADPTIFKRYNLRRDSVQAEAAERRTAYLAAQRGTRPRVPSIATPKGPQSMTTGASRDFRHIIPGPPAAFRAPAISGSARS